MSDSTLPAQPVVPNPGSRVAWIDQLRLLACMAVVFIHVSGLAYSRFADAPWWEWWLANLMNASSRASVPVFMMISGALMRESDCDALSFYRKKALRFLPVLLAWSALYGAFDIVVMGYSFRDLVVEFVTLGHVYLHLWYLGMFAFMLAFAPFLARFRFSVPCSPRDWKLLVLVSVAFVFIDWGLQMTSRALGVAFNPWTRTFIVFIPYFLLGGWLSSPKPATSRPRYALLLACALTASWAANYMSCRFFGMVDDSMPLAYHSPLVLAVAVAVFLLARSGINSSMKSPYWLAAAGESALGIYLLHPIFIWLFRRLLRETDIEILGGWWMPLTAVAAFGVSLVCVLLLRRFPPGRRIC